VIKLLLWCILLVLCWPLALLLLVVLPLLWLMTLPFRLLGFTIKGVCCLLLGLFLLPGRLVQSR